MYTVARERNNRDEENVEKFRRTLIQFIILLERWPHTLALILEMETWVVH